MRLGKFLAHAGIASRRRAEDLVRAGRVSVAGVTVRDPARDVDEGSAVAVDGKPVAGAEPHEFWALHKPAGVVSTAKDTHGRRTVLPLGCLLAVAGGLLTLPPSLPVVVTGLALLTAGFFAVHGVASGWVPARAHAGGVATGQAASLYLFTYYLGSSVFGSLAGPAWSQAAWPGVVALAVLLLSVTGGLSLVLRRTPTLL